MKRHILQAIVVGFPDRAVGGPSHIVADLIDENNATGGDYEFCFVSAHASLKRSDLWDMQFDTPVNPEVRRHGVLRKQIVGRLETHLWGRHLKYRMHQQRIRRGIARLVPRPDLVHAHEATVPGMLEATAQVPLVLTIHSKGSLVKDMLSDVDQGTSRFAHFLHALEGKGVRSADVVVFPSKAAMRLFEHDRPELIDSRRMCVIYNGINLDSFPRELMHARFQQRSSVGEALILLNVAAMVPQKRFDRCLSILAELHRRGVNARLRHIGDGPLTAYWKKQVDILSLTKQVEFFGKLSHNEVLSHYNQATVCLSTGERTVFDLTILEAMAAGIPVVACNEGGNAEALVDGASGFLCTSDHIGEYADAIAVLARDAEICRNIVQQARQRVEQEFTVKNMASKYKEVYNDLLEEKER